MMIFAEQCLQRPIAVMLLWLAVMVAGAACWFKLPIAALPNYDTPTIQVSASLSGASPETMASSVATPPSFRKINPADAPIIQIGIDYLHIIFAAA